MYATLLEIFPGISIQFLIILLNIVDFTPLHLTDSCLTVVHFQESLHLGLLLVMEYSYNTL